MKKVIIIGAGLCGLTSGTYLLKKGFAVEIYEKNNIAGGFVTGWVRKNQFIDGCIHWMVGTSEGSGINKIWHDIGGIDDNTIIYSPNTFYSIKYNGEVLNLYNDYDKLETELYKHSINDDERIAELISALKHIGIFEVPSTTAYELADKKEMLNKLRIIARVRRFTSITLEEYAKEWNSEIIKFALTHGLVDKKFNVFYFLQTLSNLCMKNADIPIGGSKELALRIVKHFEKLGGKIHYNSPVDEIIVSDGHAYGIKVGNEIIRGDYFIPACDIHYTMDNLLHLDLKPYNEYDSKKEDFITYSFIIASYKVKSDMSKEEIATIVYDNYSVAGMDMNYVSIRQYGYDETMVNDGYSTVEVFISTYEEAYDYVKSLNKEEYKRFKNEIGEFYLSYLKKYYKTNDVELLDVLTPLTYERYMNSYKGSFMTYILGKSSQVMRSNLIDEIDNVVLSNQWIMMPGGTCVALSMGKFASQLIMNKENIDFNL